MFCVCEWERNEGVFVCERVRARAKGKKAKEREFKHLGREPVYIKQSKHSNVARQILQIAPCRSS